MTLTELGRAGAYRRYLRYRSIYYARWNRVTLGALAECCTPEGLKAMRRRIRTEKAMREWALYAGVAL